MRVGSFEDRAGQHWEIWHEVGLRMQLHRKLLPVVPQLS